MSVSFQWLPAGGAAGGGRVSLTRSGRASQDDDQIGGPRSPARESQQVGDVHRRVERLRSRRSRWVRRESRWSRHVRTAARPARARREPTVSLTRAPLGLLDFHALLGGGCLNTPPF